MKKAKQRNYLILVLVVLLLALAVGYAAFTTSLTITGTATASGSWNIYFNNLSYNKEEGVFEATCDNDKTLTISTAKLTQPGDKKTLSVDVVNDGSVDAVLGAFNVKTSNTSSKTAGTTVSANGGTVKFGVITMTITPATAKDDTTNLVAGGATTYTITIEWPSDVTTADVADSFDFTITLQYDQKV